MINHNKNYWKFPTFVLSLIGAAAWIPHGLDYFSPAVIKGNLVGWAKTEKTTTATKWNIRENKQIELKGIFYIPRVALTSLNKDFNVNFVDVYATYKGDQEIYKGRCVTLNELNIKLREPNGNVSDSKLLLPQNEQIAMLSVIKKNEVTIVFIPFIVDKATLSECTTIEFKFYDYDNHCKTLRIDLDKIDWLALPTLERYYLDRNQPSPSNSDT